MKQQTNTQKKAQNYVTPLIKGKIQRNRFHSKLKQWLHQRFYSLYATTQCSNNSITSNVFDPFSKQKICKKLQKQYHIKFSIQNMINKLSLQFFQTIIKYVIEKKLSWIFKCDDKTNENSQTHNYQIEVELSIQIKKMYKNVQYNQIPHVSTGEGIIKNLYSDKGGFKKHNNDFQFQLMIIVLVQIVSSFFSSFFPEVSLNTSFKSQIYVIITHAFLNLQVSTAAYMVLRKKYCYYQKQRQIKSLNTSAINNFSNHSSKKQQPKSDHNQISKKTINHTASNFNSFNKQQGNQNKQSLRNIQVKSLSTSKSGKLINSGSNGMNSTIGFSVSSIKRLQNKKQILLKPSSSIDNNLLTQRQNTLNQSNSYNCSRFQSFLQNTKQLSVPQNIEQLLNNQPFLSQDQLKFFSSIKDNLYVDSLPPIIKKKIDINQLSRLNQLKGIKQIKKQIKQIDANSKKHCINSNDLSLAMNTFISTSCGILKKKRNKKDLQIISNYLQKQNPNHQKQSINSHQISKQRRSLEMSKISGQYQFRKLPLKSANIKLTPQKSSNLYAFSDHIAKSGDLKLYKQNFNHKNQYQNIRLTAKSKSTQKNLERVRKIKQNQFYQKKKKSTTEWSQFISNLKMNHGNHEIMSLCNKQSKLEKRKHLQRKILPYMKQCSRNQIKQYDMNIPLRTQNQIKLATQKHLNIQTENQNISNDCLQKQNKVKQKSQKYIINSQSDRSKSKDSNLNSRILGKISQNKQHRQSCFGQLSNGLDSYEINSNEVVDMDEVSQNTNRNQVQNGKYSSLQGQVNIHKDISLNYKSLYKSFDLRKRLKHFQDHCKKRQQKAIYSVFNVKNHHNPFCKIQSDRIQICRQQQQQ